MATFKSSKQLMFVLWLVELTADSAEQSFCSILEAEAYANMHIVRKWLCMYRNYWWVINFNWYFGISWVRLYERIYTSLMNLGGSNWIDCKYHALLIACTAVRLWQADTHKSEVNKVKCVRQSNRPCPRGPVLSQRKWFKEQNKGSVIISVKMWKPLWNYC